MLQHLIFIDFTGENPTVGFLSAKKEFFIVGRGRDGIPLIQKLLKKMKTKPEGIVAVAGPGRFSAVRGGVITANMLAEIWRIKIAGLVKKDGESFSEIFRRGALMFKKGKAKKEISPFYYAPPNITTPKIFSHTSN